MIPTLLAWFQVNWPNILELSAALHVTLGVINKLIPEKWQSARWAAFVDALGALGQRGKTGAVFGWSPPMMRSRELPASGASSGGAAAAMLPLALLGLMALGACATPGGQAWGRCELGLLPQSSQTVIACAEGALTSPADWQAELTACGASLLPGQLNCVIAAIIGAASGGVKAAPGSQAELVLTRAQIWLNAHGGAPKACCKATALRLRAVEHKLLANEPRAVDTKLAELLAHRDEAPVDLAAVGQSLSRDYSKIAAWSAVTRSWSKLTADAPTTKASDVMWVKDQPPRVRDLAWLITYRSEWF